MEPIDAAQARDHVEMLDRILVESQQRLCAGGEYFVVWGLYSGLATTLNQLAVNRMIPMVALWALVPVLAACIVFSVMRGRYVNAARNRASLLQREFLNVLWLTIGLAFVVDIAAFNLFSGWGGAAIWSFAMTVVLFFIGLHGNRRALLAGIAVVASIIAANFASHSIAGYILAAGMILGYTGFGIADLLARD